MAFNLRDLALISLLFLASCSQTMTTSTVRIRLDLLSENEITALQEKVVQRAEASGGKCTLLSEVRQRYVCSIQDKNGSTTISVGYRKDGGYSISINTTTVYWFGPDDADIEAGKFVTDLHIEFEDWINENIDPDIIEYKERAYINHDHSEEF